MWGESGDADYQIGAGEKREGWDLLKPPPPIIDFHCVLDVNYGRGAGRKREGSDLLKVPPPYNRSHCALDVNYGR